MNTKKIVPTINYRLKGKKLFLTYNPCNIELKEILRQVENKLINSSNFVADYLIVKKYVLESIHVYAYLVLNKSYDSKNERCFDLMDGINSIHGNYQAAKYMTQSIESLLKGINDKSDQTNILYSKGLENLIIKKGEFLKLDNLLLLLAKEGKIKEAMELLKRENPRRYISSHMRLEKSLRSIYLKEMGFESKFKGNAFIIPDHLKTEPENLLVNNKVGKTKLIEPLDKKPKIP